LGVALQDGHRDHPAAAEVGVERGEVADPADVRGFVEDRDEGRVEAAAVGFGGADRGPQHPVGEGRDEGGGAAAAVFAEQVEGSFFPTGLPTGTCEDALDRLRRLPGFRYDFFRSK